MTTTEKMKSFYFAGKELSSKLKAGEPLNPMTIKESFRDTDSKTAVTVHETMVLAQYIKGLMMDAPSSNMSYYEALGHAVSRVNPEGMTSHTGFTKILRSKANAEEFMSHPSHPQGMTLAEAFCLSGFNMGLVGNKVIAFD
jgi:hypothetical protein